MRHLIAVLITSFCLIAPVPTMAESEGSYFAIVVTDLEASLEWYESALGLEVGVRLKEHGKFEIANLRKAGLFVELIQLDAATDRPENFIKGPFKVGMIVTNLSDFVAQLPDSIPEPEVTSDVRNGLRLVQLRDPDNNVIQVMEVLDHQAK